MGMNSVATKVALLNYFAAAYRGAAALPGLDATVSARCERSAERAQCAADFNNRIDARWAELRRLGKVA